MTSNSFSANGPKGPVEKTILSVLSKINFVGYIPLNARSRLEIKSVSVLQCENLMIPVRTIPY